MSYNTKKFLDTEGVKHLIKLLDNYPNNQILGTVIDSIQDELDKKANASSILVNDVQINGTSILNNKEANIPIASSNNAGVVSVRSGDNGLQVSNGYIMTYPAMSSDIKNGTHQYRQPAVNKQHEAVFYGLAKAAGSDEKDSTLAVGQYTNAAKTAIRTMIGATSSDIIAVQDETPTDADTKIWLPETEVTPVQIPTVAEMEQAIDDKLDEFVAETQLVETVTGTDVTINGNPNVRYVCGEVTSISIIPPAQGIINVMFISGATPAVLTLPSNVQTPSWFLAASLDANTIYDILITDGVYGSVMTWAS